VTRALKKHSRAVVAIVFLAVVAMGVSGYILSHQRLYLPAWVPVVGTDFYVVDAEFETAQAVVPGQGQTVNIAGVKVGDIGSVTLKDGHAVVQMKIKRRYAPIYRNATILLRPKTGLKDMYLELDPGSQGAGEVPENGTIPVSDTLPDVNPDEVLAQLDGDTRAYLRILLGSGAQAFEGDSPEQLRASFRRFEPTARDAAKINALLAIRRQSVRHVVHNFQELATELGSKDHQLASLIDSSNANFQALASQDQNLRRSLRLLPGTLGQTATTLAKVDALSQNLGPAVQKLRPGARALGSSLAQTRPFLRETTPVVKKQLRPFARDVRPPVRDLRKAAGDLAVATPRLVKTFKFVNTVLNELAYNPPGSEEGFLFWNSWAAHNAATVFGTEDAHGPVRRGLLLVSCDALGVLDQIKQTTPTLEVLIDLLNAPRKSAVCPSQVP
jgi:phospholipid/cholesterol/gamma-HCH transport system substrate-binding protein